MKKLIIGTMLAFTVGISFLMGSLHSQYVMENSTIDRVKFGYAGYTVDELEQYPQCQTDFEHSELWSIRMVYLSGAWTAGCIEAVNRHNEENANKDQ